MGVYIKNMEKPNKCVYCPLYRYYYENGNVWCNALNVILETIPYEMRLLDSALESIEPHPDCPLVSVTEPHGDLIDRERIDYKNYKMHDGKGNLIVSDTFVDGVTWVDNCIYDTPTVIEAEGE